MQSLEEEERRTQELPEQPEQDERRTLADAPAPPRASTLPLGTALDRYVVLEPLGEGGMGQVYAAYDSVLDRKVALKLLPPEDPTLGAEATSGRARLLREAQAMARLSHPNVVAVYDVHQHGAQVFMAMELVDGRTLSQWQQQEPRGWRDILAAFLAAGRGLAAAHQAGLVHRDFKPANVLVGKDGRVRVTDFGLARTHNAPPEPPSPESTRDAELVKSQSLLQLELTQRGTVLGTPAYMAPEQLRNGEVRPSVDIYALGLVLLEALTGTPGFAPTHHLVAAAAAAGTRSERVSVIRNRTRPMSNTWAIGPLAAGDSGVPYCGISAA